MRDEHAHVLETTARNMLALMDPRKIDAELRLYLNALTAGAAALRGAQEHEKEIQDHGAALAADVNDTGSSPSETASEQARQRVLRAAFDGLAGKADVEAALDAYALVIREQVGR